MNLSPGVAERIRLGIVDAKMDIAVGPECHDHEPAGQPLTAMYGWDMPSFDRVAEKAYWHVFEHQPR